MKIIINNKPEIKQEIIKIYFLLLFESKCPPMKDPKPPIMMINEDIIEVKKSMSFIFCH
ncbi:uncharacterized protein METZ01_LOCUS187308 [marine metagenome]|uniref:Uncharacterized protein n=1 Tax=marine metagenome TaxID=408172 RepID=A0A382D8U1_9ZZZZ